MLLAQRPFEVDTSAAFVVRAETRVRVYIDGFNLYYRALKGSPHGSFVEVLDSEEKGSDVNLAVHLINDAWRKEYELALVLSQDTDLAEAMRIVKDELDLKIGLVWLDGSRPNPNLAGVASFVRHISNADLAASQFPASIMRADGTVLTKPQGW